MHVIETGRGVSVRLQLSEFQRRWRVDVRQYFEFRFGDPDSAKPTKRGVNLAVSDLPALRAAVEGLERDALRRGLLEMEDYQAAGLPVPRELTEAA